VEVELGRMLEHASLRRHLAHDSAFRVFLRLQIPNFDTARFALRAAGFLWCCHSMFVVGPSFRLAKTSAACKEQESLGAQLFGRGDHELVTARAEPLQRQLDTARLVIRISPDVMPLVQ
jgi:hypothetical protein